MRSISHHSSHISRQLITSSARAHPGAPARRPSRRDFTSPLYILYTAPIPAPASSSRRRSATCGCRIMLASTSSFVSAVPGSSNPYEPVVNLPDYAQEPVREEPTPYEPVVNLPDYAQEPVREVAQNYTPAEQEAVTSDVQEVIDALQGDSDAGGDFGDLGFEQSDDLGVSDFGGSNFDENSYDFQGMANGGLMAAHRYAMGGSTLGGYSDGGRLLRGPGDGVSDSIPATIGKKRQPARLADGEFVIPARIVSELGNGSTEAGARKLYAMMERIQATRGRTVGKNRVATNSRADRYLPA